MEYLATKCRNAIAKWAHKRLGPTPKSMRLRYPGLPLSAVRVYQPYADAVCVWPDRIEIIEFKVHDPIKAISQLQLYRALAEQDPELARWRGKPIVLKLVYWRYDENIAALCKANGIVYEVELPAWLEPILREYGYKL